MSCEEEKALIRRPFAHLLTPISMTIALSCTILALIAIVMKVGSQDIVLQLCSVAIRLAYMS